LIDNSAHDAYDTGYTDGTKALLKEVDSFYISYNSYLLQRNNAKIVTNGLIPDGKTLSPSQFFTEYLENNTGV
jgi:hypothetical protein